MIIVKLLDLKMKPGDEVVAAVTHRDEIVIITKRGELFRLYTEEMDR